MSTDLLDLSLLRSARAVADEACHLGHGPVRRMRLQESAQEGLARHGALLRVVDAPELLKLFTSEAAADGNGQRGRVCVSGAGGVSAGQAASRKGRRTM